MISGDMDNMTWLGGKGLLSCGLRARGIDKVGAGIIALV
jgi:hypothetical protein